jgi:hypothetical protein
MKWVMALRVVRGAAGECLLYNVDGPFHRMISSLDMTGLGFLLRTYQYSDLLVDKILSDLPTTTINYENLDFCVMAFNSNATFRVKNSIFYAYAAPCHPVPPNTLHHLR